MSIILKILVNLIIVLFLLVLIVGLISYLLVQGFFVRRKSQDEEYPEKDSSGNVNEQYEKCRKESIKGVEYINSLEKEDLCIESEDGLKLRAYYIPAEKKSDKCVICVHGYRSTGIKDYGYKSEFMHSLGWNLLLPDDRAHGRSEGRYIGFGVQDAKDVRLWIEEMTKKLGKDSTIVLFGISMGGATVLNVSGMENLPSNVKGVIDDCGFSSGMDEAIYQLKKWIHLPRFPFLSFTHCWLRILAHYNLCEMEAKKQIKKFKGKLLVIHGGDDDFVPTDMGREIFDAAVCEKELYIVEGANHASAYVYDTENYQKKVGSFLNDI